MAIPSSRTKEVAIVNIDHEKCNGCGLCVDVCKDFSLVMSDGKAVTSAKPIFGCIACGHCMAICPKEAIRVEGRFLSHKDLFPQPPKENNPSYESILNLLKRRRSMREFKNKTVSPLIIHKILDAAKTAPMGLPPSDVNVLILDGKEKVRKFSDEYCDFLQGMRWLVSGWFLGIMRPFWGKANDELFRGFIRPMVDVYTSEKKKGNNLVTYDAPIALYFYGSKYCDPADPIIAATYAMIAAESLGLGTCMLGGIHPMIQSGRAARKFREKWNIRYKSREGLFLIIGYPRVKYPKGISRTFANIDVLV